MNILDQIIATKKEEVALKTSVLPQNTFEKMPLFGRETYSLSASIKRTAFGIIAEHKRKSPSKGQIGQDIHITDIIREYSRGGAAGVSILTDCHYFGGNTEDLLLARASAETPLLRKEFIISEYQILEAKVLGADAILLIAAVLSATELKTLTAFAHSLQLEVLLEIHDEAELEKAIAAQPDLIGVNNRNLATFNTDIETSKRLASQIPNEFVKVSESGIESPSAIIDLMQYGFQGFLIGENFMKTENPGRALSVMIHAVNQLL